MSRRDPILTALLCGLSFLAGVCLMDVQSRRAIDELAADNIELSRGASESRYHVSTADPRWATPIEQIKRPKRYDISITPDTHCTVGEVADTSVGGVEDQYHYECVAPDTWKMTRMKR